MTLALGETMTLPNGRSVGYLARGPADGRPVIYVHGWPGCRLEQLVIPDDALVRHGVRLIAVDRPGYGLSDPLSGTRSERMADVLGVCDELGVASFAAMGVSCGGSNVVALAASAPERVSRLVLLSAQMPYDYEPALTELDPEQFAELPAARRGRTSELVADEESYRIRLKQGGLKEVLDHEKFSTPEQAWMSLGWVTDVLEADVQEAVRASAEGLIEDFIMHVKPFEFSMNAVRCPVFAVHCTSDDWEPLANLQRILVQFEQSQLILLEGLSHLGWCLYPDLALSLATETAGITA